jgi:hypothetical protein
MTIQDRSDLDQLAQALAAMLAAWWFQHARAEEREDDLVGKTRSNRGGAR